jgi:hypothetical protein
LAIEGEAPPSLTGLAPRGTARSSPTHVDLGLQIAAVSAQLADLRARAADALVVAIVLVGEHHIFNAREVLVHAAIDLHLREALDTAGVTSCRSLGHFLRRHDGRSVSGVRIVRAWNDYEGAIWIAEFDAQTQGVS